MKYKSINELFTFDLHDAYIDKMEYVNNQMKWHLTDANIQTNNSQNTYSVDMCTKDFMITFENTVLFDMYFIGCEVSDDKGNIIQVIPNRQIENDKMIDTLIDLIKKEPCVLGHCKTDNGVCFTIHRDSDVLEFEFNFTKCIAEWDKFDKKAWYVNL